MTSKCFLSLHPIDCFHLIFFRCVAILILSCAPPPVAGSGGSVFASGKPGEFMKPDYSLRGCFSLRSLWPLHHSPQSEFRINLTNGLTNSHWRLVVPKFYDQLQPFFPASAVTNFGLPRLGSGQWLSSRMFLQEEKSCCLWPWRGLPGSGGWYTPETSRNLYNITKMILKWWALESVSPASK